MTAMRDDIERRTADIRRELAILRRRLQEGDESELVVWIIPGQLACSQRPLRYNKRFGGSARTLTPDAAPYVTEWADMIQVYGIQSIICLMSDTEIGFYKDLDLGTENLIAFYRTRFHVRHLPWEDPHHSKSSRETIEEMLLRVREAALAAFNELPKPVLLHCSAGVDRSAPVAAYISTRTITPDSRAGR